MNKYRNIKTVVDGITFDSKAEAKYYGVLKMRKLAGEIEDFLCQVHFKLIVNGQLICTYIADFVITRTEGKTTIYESIIDCKGVKTPAYLLKKKLMKACYNIDIKEVK